MFGILLIKLHFVPQSQLIFVQYRVDIRKFATNTSHKMHTFQLRIFSVSPYLMHVQFDVKRSWLLRRLVFLTLTALYKLSTLLTYLRVGIEEVSTYRIADGGASLFKVEAANKKN